jgi:hypothetical protein
MIHDLEGRPVSEEEAAVSLGFADVPAFRRWKTVQGQRVWELEVKLLRSERELDELRWHLKRTEAVLRRIEPKLTDPLLRLAVGVVLGRDVDWKGELKDFWEGP